MSVGMLPTRLDSTGPVERSLRERAVEARRRLFSGSPPAPKAIVLPRPLSPFDPRRLDAEIAAAVASNPPPPMPPWKVVLAEAAQKYGVPVGAIVGASRSRSILPARHECAYRMVMELGMSYPATGRRLNRDHTTVIHAVERHIARNPHLKPAVEAHKADERKLRESIEEEIIRLYFDEDETPSAISHQLDVTRAMVHSVVRREVLRVREARRAA